MPVAKAIRTVHPAIGFVPAVTGPAAPVGAVAAGTAGPAATGTPTGPASTVVGRDPIGTTETVVDTGCAMPQAVAPPTPATTRMRRISHGRTLANTAVKNRPAGLRGHEEVPRPERIHQKHRHMLGELLGPRRPGRHNVLPPLRRGREAAEDVIVTSSAVAGVSLGRYAGFAAVQPPTFVRTGCATA
jgi:hypothetical protein